MYRALQRLGFVTSFGGFESLTITSILGEGGWVQLESPIVVVIARDAMASGAASRDARCQPECSHVTLRFGESLDSFPSPFDSLGLQVFFFDNMY